MRFASFSIFILIFSGSVAHAQATWQVGGKGGAFFADGCRPGDVMVGYNVTAGKGMNTFAVVCQSQSNGVLIGKNCGLHTWGSNHGGGYHYLLTPRCPENAAITELEVWVNVFNEVDSVRADCSPLRANTGGMSTLVKTTSDGVPVAQASTECPWGTYAIGAVGRSGALVDALGLQCAAPSWH